MRKVFVDTSGIIAFENVRDIDHTEAVRTLRVLQTSQPVRLVTSDYVLTEFCNSFSKLGWRPKALRYIDEALFEEALELYRSRPDKEWSLTDCSSFIVMRQTEIVEAFATDVHFEQAGFGRLIHPSR